MQKRSVRNRALETVAVAKEVSTQIMRPAVLAFAGSQLFRMKLFSARPAGSKPALFQALRAFLTFSIRRQAQHPATRIKRTETPVSQLLPVVSILKQSPRVNLRTAENGCRLMCCQKIALHCLPCSEAPPRPALIRTVHHFPFQRRFGLLQPKPVPVRTRADLATGRDRSCQSSG